MAAWTDEDVLGPIRRRRLTQLDQPTPEGLPARSPIGAETQPVGGTGLPIPPTSAVPAGAQTATTTAPTVPASGSPYDWSINAPALPSVASPALPPAGGGLPGGATDPAFRNQINGMVLQLLNQNQNPTIQDPELAGLAATNRQTLDRANALRQRQVAEQLGQAGLGTSGAMQSALERGAADVGTSQAGYEAGLVNTAKQQRMAQIQNALQLGAGMMSDADKNALSRELAQLQASTQTTLGLGDLALRRWLAQLQNQQFQQQLGFNTADREAYYNYLATNGLM